MKNQTTEDLDNKQKELRFQIECLEVERKEVLNKLFDMELSSKTDPIERLEVLIDPKYHLIRNRWSCMQNIVSSSRKGLLEYGNKIVYWERYQTIDIEMLFDYIYSAYEELDENGLYINKYDKKKRVLCTRQDIEDWIESLIKVKFGECIMDW